MIKHVPFATLGKANHGWLKANHHFSFAHYYNPQRMGFGVLRVINDDWVAPNMGFPPHPHNNMEIITFVRSGSVSHQDDAGNKGVTTAGEVQVMSAGSGIVHSEYNRSKEPLTLYQIWIESNRQNVKPRWDSKKFPSKANQEALTLLVSGDIQDSKEALFINQQAKIFGGNIAKGTTFEHKIEHQAYILASKGRFKINDNTASVVLEKGDGAEVTKTSYVTIEALQACEIVLIDVPAH